MLPEAFIKEINEILKSEAPAFFDALGNEKCGAFRVNTLRNGAYAAAEQYANEQVPWEGNGYYIKEGTRPGAGLAHICGAVYIQDASAMAPVSVLAPQPGEVILDMCAAPGGKSSQIAARLNGSGALVSNEYVKNRSQILKSNLERLGVVNACVTNASPDKFDKPVFDAILVDAPCSGEGMFRRDENAVTEWSAESPESCAQRQAKILDCAAEALKPGGRLVYSTCTFNRSENEGSITGFLSRHPEFEVWDFELPGVGSSQNGCLRLWPHRIKGEGHFVARLRKQGIPVYSQDSSARASKEAAAVKALLFKDAVRKLPAGNYEIINGELWLVPEKLPEIKNVYTLSKGLLLGKAGKGFFEPAHALAMALTPEAPLRSIELDDENASLYMQGEALNVTNENGWTLVTWNGMPLGWGKVSGGILKNHLPKGLRLRGGHAVKT